MIGMKLVRAAEGELVGRLSTVAGAARAKDGGENGKRSIAGIAAPYDSWTTLVDRGGFVWRERYAAGCFAGTLDSGDDVRACFNHRLNDILGRRAAGTLRLTETEEGLAYEVSVNGADPMAVGVYARVARGDVPGASCWFLPTRIDTVMTRDGDTERVDDTIVEARLYECGPVTDGQYSDATAAARAVRGMLSAVADESYRDFQAALRAAGG